MIDALRPWLPLLGTLTGLALLLLWLRIEGALPDPDHCYLERVRRGRAECGGRCCQGRLPCQPVPRKEART
jgi:hypothetical protein